jgi:NAD(P)H dehydrogenase (quinone)
VTAVAVVYHSQTGRTKALAEAVARGAASVDDVTVKVIPVEDAPRSQDVLAAADVIVFGCPTYMGSASGQFKTFMDGTSAIWALQGWRDKLAAGFTHSAAPSGDKLGTLTQLAVFAAQHGMVWVGLGLPPTYVAGDPAPDDLNRLGSHLGAMAQSRPGGGTLPPSDEKTCEHLGKRVATAARRWNLGLTRSRMPSITAGTPRHPTARSWVFPPVLRTPLPEGFARTNLREIAAREDRFEHHLMVCATLAGVRLEVTTASEPLYFAHINVSDEYAAALQTGDELVDRFPLRTFLTDPRTGEDVGRYNHRVSDLVLHPEGLLHWPGRLRPPYEPFEFPAGMRRAGLSLVFCASSPTEATWCPLPPSGERAADAKAYVEPPPPMALTALRGRPGVVARIGETSLSLLELPQMVDPPRGGWLVVLEVDPTSSWAAGDLVRLPAGSKLLTRGVARALLLTHDTAEPDPVPPLWTETPAPPFAPYEDAEPGEMPFEQCGIRIFDSSETFATVTVAEAHADVPRYWLARMLFRLALHGLRIGYAETYGRFFFDDRGEDVRVGIASAEGDAAVTVPRADAMKLVEDMYRAVAPRGYRERPA